MKLNIRQLKFSLPDKPFGHHLEHVQKLENQLKELAGKAGTENEKFRRAYDRLHRNVELDRNLANELDTPIKVRALALMLNTEIGEKLKLTERVLAKIDQLRPRPSSLLIQNLYQYYLTHYDRNDNHHAIAMWLLNALPKRDLKQPFHDQLLGLNGPKWMAQEAISKNREFQNQIVYLGLDKYASGHFMTVANNIYFVEQLRNIPVNQPHDLLREVQKPSVYNRRFDEHLLLGHKVLEILISRAANTKVDDSWRDVVLAIAGDPRVPRSNLKYQKWWSQIDKKLRTVVNGWLSKLDLRLFLEALENFSNLPGKYDLQSMFPSRKKFLEGLEDKKLVTKTRLYLARGAERYLCSQYKKEHLPSYSIVKTTDKSLIYVQLGSGNAHLIEGSHSCRLWIYRHLHDSAVVFDYSKTNVSYPELTQELNSHMREFAEADIIHNRITWQHKALKTLNRIGINIRAQDVLTLEDYKEFKRKFGAI
ncbi:MAG: EH signature domain-containing protein [Thermodesulfobacteriota bacterium]|nr:EH signature domain-containing protein [Thermodesulfobacteriota bacterium]